MKHYLAIVFVVGFAACGADEYDAEAPNALSHRLDPPQMSIGSLSSEHAELKRIADSKDCPRDTLCIRGPYVGENQFAHIVVDRPDLMAITSGPEKRMYRIKSSIPKVRIESDLMEIPKEIRLESCTPRLEIMSKEVIGTGVIDSSADPCGRRDAGNVTIISPAVSALKIKAIGSNGKKGADANPSANKRQAANGNPNGLNIHVYFDAHRMKSELAYHGTYIPALENHFEELSKNGWFSETDFENYLNREFKGFPKGSDRWYQSPFVISFASSDRCDSTSIGRTSIFDDAEARLENIESLNGKAANKVWPGSDGEPGGNGAHIE